MSEPRLPKQEKRPIHPASTNPKDRVGSLKAPLYLIPREAKYQIAMALVDGALEYGSYNWRDETISASVYLSAIERHLDAFKDGEDLAPDTAVSHLAHATATLCIMMDSMAHGSMRDDRPPAHKDMSAAKRFQEWFKDRAKGRKKV